MIVNTLFGTLASLDDLFADFGFFFPGHDVPAGYLPLNGLPGSVRVKDRKFLFIKPRQAIRDAVADRCTNGAIGGFRSIQSAQYMREGLLPVFAYDFPRIVSFQIALVPHAEHERFANAKHSTSPLPSAP